MSRLRTATTCLVLVGVLGACSIGAGKAGVEAWVQGEWACESSWRMLPDPVMSPAQWTVTVSDGTWELEAANEETSHYLRQDSGSWKFGFGELTVSSKAFARGESKAAGIEDDDEVSETESISATWTYADEGTGALEIDVEGDSVRLTQHDSLDASKTTVTTCEKQ